MSSVGLVGQVILIVEDERGPFAQHLQAALERVGAESMLAHTPARARDHASRFDFLGSGDLRRWRSPLS